MYFTFRCNEVMGVTEACSGRSALGRLWAVPTQAPLVAGPGLQEVGACSSAVGGLCLAACAVAGWDGQGRCAGVGPWCSRVGGGCIEMLIPTCSAVGACSWEFPCNPLGPLTTSDLQVGSGLEPATSDWRTLSECDRRLRDTLSPKELSEPDTGGRG